MKEWKSETKHKKHDVWVTEIRLNNPDTNRAKKVDKLIKLLKKESIKGKV